MAADRQAVESMVSRVKATASKTAAKMTGRSSGPSCPTWETGEPLKSTEKTFPTRSWGGGLLRISDFQ